MASVIIAIDEEYVGTKELNETVTVGRAPTCGLQILASQISRSHLLLQKIGDGWQVVDLNSTNGTWFGKERIAAHTLADGHIIRLGNVTITFFDSPIAPISAATPAIDATHFGDATASGEVNATRSDEFWDEEVAKIVNVRDSDSIDEEAEDSIREITLEQLESLDNYPRLAVADAHEANAANSVDEAHVEARVGASFAHQQSETSAEPHPASQSHFDRVNLWDAANQSPLTYREISARLSNSHIGNSPTDAPRADSISRRLGVVIDKPEYASEYGSLNERFQHDLKFQIGVIASAAAALLVSGYLWAGATGIIRHDPPRINNATISSRPALSPSQTRKLLADIPV